VKNTSEDEAPLWTCSATVQKLFHFQTDSSNLAKLWSVNERAAFAYVPKVYPGRITHFRPMRQYRRYDGPERGWDQLADRGVEVWEMPVYPAGMLVELSFAKTSAEAQNGGGLGGGGVNTIIGSIQQEDSGGGEPGCAWSAHI